MLVLVMVVLMVLLLLVLLCSDGCVCLPFFFCLFLFPDFRLLRVMYIGTLTTAVGVAFCRDRQISVYTFVICPHTRSHSCVYAELFMLLMFFFVFCFFNSVREISSFFAGPFSFSFPFVFLCRRSTTDGCLRVSLTSLKARTRLRLEKEMGLSGGKIASRFVLVISRRGRAPPPPPPPRQACFFV